MESRYSLTIHKVDTVNQLRNVMTKGLVEDKFRPLRDHLIGWNLNQALPDARDSILKGDYRKVRLV